MGLMVFDKPDLFRRDSFIPEKFIEICSPSLFLEMLFEPQVGFNEHV